MNVRSTGLGGFLAGNGGTDGGSGGQGGGGGGAGMGGAVFLYFSFGFFKDVTFTTNGAEGGLGGNNGATPGSSCGGAIFTYNSAAQLVNPVFNGNLADQQPDVCGYNDPRPAQLAPITPTPPELTDVALAETSTSKGRIAVRWYTFTVSNVSTTDARGVELFVDLPSGFKVDRNALSDACTRSTTEVHCTLDVLAAGAAWTVDVKLYGAEHPPTTLPAVVTTGTPEQNTANNAVS